MVRQIGGRQGLQGESLGLRSLGIQPVISLDLDCSNQGSFFLNYSYPMPVLGTEMKPRG